MIDFLLWFLIITLLGWVSFPLTFSILRKLPSRGFILSKVLGLLIWGFLFWILVSLNLLQNDLASQLVALGILISISIFSCWKDRFNSLLGWIKENKKLIIVTEILFLSFFSLWTFIRATNPAIFGTEKPMEMAFITSILRSPSFPPNDPWLSGYGISYYYFGYVMVSMLIRIGGTIPGVGYNLAVALWFALTAMGAYSVLFDLINIRWLDKTYQPQQKIPSWLYGTALLAPFLVLVVSNWHGFVDILHARGLFWITNSDGSQSSVFWSWLKLRELDTPPGGLLSWLPTRTGGVQWWGASRVIQDFKLTGEAIEVIDEFPFFSFLLADLHPHVVAMPFALLVISQSLNLFWGGMSADSESEKVRIFNWKFPFHSWGFILAIISLGGLAFLNTWDFPFYLALMAAAFTLERAHRIGWCWNRIWDFVLMMAGLGIPSVLLYMPFFISFSSQAGGIYPSLIFFTRGIYFWIMFGPLLLPISIFLIFSWVQSRRGRQVRASMIITLILLTIFSILNWGLSFFASQLPELSSLFLWLQGGEQEGIYGLLIQAFVKRLQDPATWLTLVIIIFLSMGLLLKSKHAEFLEDKKKIFTYQSINKSTLFVLILILWGALLAFAPEFIYLRDQFSVRMNTIFKFYFQTWIFWSLSASYGLIILWRKSKKFPRFIQVLFGFLAIIALTVFILSIATQKGSQFDLLKVNGFIANLDFGSRISDWLVLGIGIIIFILLLYSLLKHEWMWFTKLIIIVGIGMGLVYPPIALWFKTDGFSPYGGLTLDGTDYFRQIWPDQMNAVDWLQRAPLGVMVEAVSQTGGSYTTYASVSTFSGMPTVLGWVGHEFQWRGGGVEVGTRQSDIETLYSSASWDETKAIISKYNIRYIYVGALERSTYALNEGKFIQHTQIAFNSSNSVIYEVPQSYVP